MLIDQTVLARTRKVGNSVLLERAVRLYAKAGFPFRASGVGGFFACRENLHNDSHILCRHRLKELAAELLTSNRVKKCREGTKGTATLLDVVDGPFALDYGKRIAGT
ncbi:hypothetical protein [Azospirillum palustre]